MTLPASGNLTLGMVAAELGLGLPISLGDTVVRNLAGVPSGPISMSNLYGKSAGGTAPPASGPLTVQTTGGYGQSNTYGSSGIVACQVSATVSGGTGTITHLWEFTSNPGQFTLTGANGANATVSKSYSRYSSGSAQAVLRYTARDSAGAVVVAYPVYAELEWTGSQIEQ